MKQNVKVIEQSWEMVAQGKVRQIYEPEDNGYDQPLIALVAGDGVSAFDEVLDVKIKDKGKILTQMSARWFQYIEQEMPAIDTAFITAEFDELPKFFRDRPDEFAGRTMIMYKLDMLPIEAIVRGYLTGSAWKAYREGVREICGMRLPGGLSNSERLEPPLFTPTTKAPEGKHDENINYHEMVEIFANSFIAEPELYATSIQRMATDIYLKCAKYARSHGVIIADTKFEFGLSAYGRILLADEVLTPDSSRFWSSASYSVGEEQNSMDKQIIRNYIADEKAAGREVKTIPSHILDKTAAAYRDCYHRLF